MLKVVALTASVCFFFTLSCGSISISLLTVSAVHHYAMHFRDGRISMIRDRPKYRLLLGLGLELGLG